MTVRTTMLTPMLAGQLENLVALFEIQRAEVLFGGRPTAKAFSAFAFLGERVLREALLFYGASAPEFIKVRHRALDSMRQVMVRMDQAEAIEAALRKLAGDPTASADAPGRKPGKGGIAAVAWEIALHILTDPNGPPKGHGRLAELSRRVVNELAAKGRGDYQADSIAGQIRASFRDWERQNPDL